jgi:hypothetical protein
MTNDDVLYAYRLRVLANARELGSVAATCRLHRIHRSTYYRWKNSVDRFGLESLRPRERRRPQMPNSIPMLIEHRIIAYALGSPGSGPARISSELARERIGGFSVSATGVYRVLRRHGIRTRALRNGLLAGYAAPPQLARDPEPERHIEVERPGEILQFDCFCVGRLSGTKGVVWHYSAIDAASSFTWAELHVTPRNPDVRFCSLLARRVAKDLHDCGWDFERVTTDNGSEFRSHRFDETLERLGATQQHADPTRSTAVKRLRRTCPAHDPRGVLEAGVRPLPRAQIRGTSARARALPSD